MDRTIYTHFTLATPKNWYARPLVVETTADWGVFVEGIYIILPCFGIAIVCGVLGLVS